MKRLIDFGMGILSGYYLYTEKGRNDAKEGINIIIKQTKETIDEVVKDFKTSVSTETTETEVDGTENYTIATLEPVKKTKEELVIDNFNEENNITYDNIS